MKFNKLFESNLLWNMISSGLSITQDSEKIRKIVFLNITLILGTLFLGIFGVISFIGGLLIHATVDFVLTAIMFFFFFYLRKTKNVKVISMVGTLSLGIYFLFLYTSGGAENTGYLWGYTYPLIATYLYGTQKGSLISMAYLLFFVLGYVFKDIFPFQGEYPLTLVLRFIPTYILIFALAFIHEQVRLMTLARLEDTTKRLENVVDELQIAQAKLKELSIRDGLTDLYNRRHFDEIIDLSLHHAKRYGGELSLLMIDIDYFKIFNDHYGHLEGDKVLKTFSKMLKSSIDQETDTVCRYGGEEFSIILNNASLEKAAEIAENIISNTKNLTIPHAKSPFKQLTSSIGIATIPPDKEVTSHKLIEYADKALYKAKETGRNNFQYLQF